MFWVNFRWGNIWQVNEWHVISFAHHECHVEIGCLHSSRFADQVLTQLYCTNHSKSLISQFDYPPLIANRIDYSFIALIPHADQLLSPKITPVIVMPSFLTLTRYFTALALIWLGIEWSPDAYYFGGLISYSMNVILVLLQVFSPFYSYFCL